jgi:hypothetical protein
VGNRRDDVPMPPFQPNTTVPVPAPTSPSSTGPPFACGEDVVWRNVSSPNIVQESVIRFANHRVDRQHILVARQRQHVADYRVGYARHAGGGRQQDRRFDIAHLIDLRGPCQLSETITHKNCARHFLAVKIAGVRQHRRHAGTNIVPANNGSLPHLDTPNVSDGI